MKSFHSQPSAEPVAGSHPEPIPWALSPDRCFDLVVETVGLYNTAGFNDDTRAFASIPARHDVWRRVSCDWLAGQVIQGPLAEGEAAERAYELAVG